MQNEDTTPSHAPSIPDLQPSQIVYLECAGQKLYVEVIQIISDRHAAWLRPLCLCIPQTEAPSPHPVAGMENQNLKLGQISLNPLELPYTLHDMRYNSDLIWPLAHCRVALDTEVIPILSLLGEKANTSEGQGQARRIFRAFVQKMWQVPNQ